MNSRPLPYQGSALPLSYKSDNSYASNGAGDEDRTRDMQLGRLPLYQLSYSRTMLVYINHILFRSLNGGEGRIRTFETFVAELQSAPFDRSGTSPISHFLLQCSSDMYLLNGADTRIRTEDLLITSQLLYQLSYVGLI